MEAGDRETTPARTGGERRPRRSQETRSREAQARLLRATIDVLLDRGYSGLTTKEVATRAGLSNGALVHHYGTKAELVVAATAEVYEEAIQRGQRIAKSPRALKDPVKGFISDCTAVYFEWPFLAALEILMAARTDPDLMQRIQPVMERYRSTTNDLWLEVFHRAGVSREQSLLALNLTLNLVRGMAVNSLWQKDVSSYKKQLRGWAVLVHQEILAKAQPGDSSSSGDESGKG